MFMKFSRQDLVDLFKEFVDEMEDRNANGLLISITEQIFSTFLVWLDNHI